MSEKREDVEANAAGAGEPAPEDTGPIKESDLAQHIPLIRNYLRKIIREDELEDGVQTVLARALENLERYRGESAARVWLLGIARNVGYEIARARQRRPVPVLETPEPAPGGELPLGGVGPTNQEELLSNRQHQALALAALDGLSLDEKLALLVTYVDELPGPEAAELLGISFAAFRQRLSRARQSLAKQLEKLMAQGTKVPSQTLAEWQALLDPKPQKKDAKR